jgi:hypothetical protein
LCDQSAWSQPSKIPVQLFGSIGRIDWDAHGASRDGEKRHGHVWTIGQHDRDPVTTAYPHGPQRAPHLDDVLVELAVAQRCAPRSKNCQRVWTTLRVMFQQTWNGRKRNRASRLYETFGRHLSVRVRLLTTSIHPDWIDIQKIRDG